MKKLKQISNQNKKEKIVIEKVNYDVLDEKYNMKNKVNINLNNQEIATNEDVEKSLINNKIFNSYYEILKKIGFYKNNILLLEEENLKLDINNRKDKILLTFNNKEIEENKNSIRVFEGILKFYDNFKNLDVNKFIENIGIEANSNNILKEFIDLENKIQKYINNQLFRLKLNK